MIPRFTDHAANERTYLAWVRTAVSLMAFGFLLERFDIFLSYAGRSANKASPDLHVRASEWIGLGLILFGAIVILLTTLRFYKNRRLIDSETSTRYDGTILERMMAGSLMLMAIFLVVYVAHQVLAL